MVLSTEASARMHVRTEKRKPSVRIAKPGEVTATARQAAPWMASSLPRMIRNRSPRKVKPGKLSPVSPGSPGSPQQQEVVNVVTGRRALGPWSGPFKSHPDGGLDETLLPGTIFMDSRGAAHLGLDVEEHHKLLRALQEAQESSGMVNNPPPTDAVTEKAAGQLLVLRRAQVKHMQAVESIAHSSRQRVGPSLRRQRVLQKWYSQVNQPRRCNTSNLILKNLKKELGSTA